MTTNIVLASVGAGKTDHALEHIVKTLEQTPFAKVWVLLASKRQEDAFRKRLLEWRSDRAVYFNVEFFNFYELYERLLDMDGQPQRDLSDTARQRILRTVIKDIQATVGLKVFDAIALTPGFIEIMAGFIFELKQNRVYPVAFQKAAKSDKDRDLALIYAEYQERLQQHNLVDVEGQGWLATIALRRNEHLADDVALLLVDGFDQFTLVQVELLALLASRAEQAMITLTTLPGKDNPAGKRFERTLNQLKNNLPEDSREIINLPRDKETRHPDLQHLVDNAFLPKVVPKPTVVDDSALTLIEAPDPTAEVAIVLRRIKRLLISTDNNPDDILIVLRNWERYYAQFINLGRKYSLPLALHYGQPLAENPVVTALIEILQLSERGFRRREVLDALRSPYFRIQGVTKDQIILLEKISQKFNVTRGEDQWEEAIQSASRPPLGHEDDEKSEPILSEEDADYLYHDIVDFFNWVKPEEKATVRDYIDWIEQLIGLDPAKPPNEWDELDEFEAEQGGFSLDVISAMRDENTADEIVARDLSALDGFKRILKDILTAQELLERLGESRESEITWSVFLTDLLGAIGSSSINPRPNRSGRVLVTSATDARGLPHKHIFILGLSEGLFPAPTPEDPLYLDTEREALNKHEGVYLQTQSERAADDGLFYELICLPSESMTLSRPTVQDGKPWIESHLWRAVTAIFADSDALIAQHRLAIGQVVPAFDVASLDEAVVAVSDGLSSELNTVVTDVYNWLSRAQSAYWSHVLHNRQIEMYRASNRPHNHYTGRLADERLIDYVRNELSPKRVWSASQLNDLGVCGFRYFAKRLLKLNALEEPDEGMDVLQRGTLYHAILEKTYNWLQKSGLAIIADNLDEAVRTLESVAVRELANAPQQLGFRADATWEQEQSIILRDLEALVVADFSDKNPINKKFGSETRQAYRFEQSFGFRGQPPVEIDLGEDAGTLKVHGFIDRIDRQGNRAIIMDYKSGSTAIPIRDMREGRNFQMMVYMLAGEQILSGELEVAGGLFWHISNQKTSGDILLSDDTSQEAIAEAKTHIVNYLKQARQGNFAVQPKTLDNGRCVRYCEFYQLCRVSNTNLFKNTDENNS